MPGSDHIFVFHSFLTDFLIHFMIGVIEALSDILNHLLILLSKFQVKGVLLLDFLNLLLFTILLHLFFISS